MNTCVVDICDQPGVLCGMEITDPKSDGLVVHLWLCMQHMPIWAAWVSVIHDPRLESAAARRARLKREKTAK